MKVLEEAAKAGVRRVWIQPGAFDEKCISFAKNKGMTVVYGHEEELGHEGACVLVHGERGLAAAAGKL